MDYNYNNQNARKTFILNCLLDSFLFKLRCNIVNLPELLYPHTYVGEMTTETPPVQTLRKNNEMKLINITG